MDILILLADLALTVFVYCSPAAVYRFLVKKEPAEKKLARNFCIISSVIVYLLLLVIYLSAGFDMVPNVAAAAIWGFVSYRILLYEDKAKGKSNSTPSESPSDAPVQLSIFDAPDTQPVCVEEQPIVEQQEAESHETEQSSESVSDSGSHTQTASESDDTHVLYIFVIGVCLLVLILSIVLVAIEYC